MLRREFGEGVGDDGIGQVKALLAPLGLAEPGPLICPGTHLGRQAQVDQIIAQQHAARPLATLGYGRTSFVGFATDTTTVATCGALRAAFDGVPTVVLFDTTQSLLLDRDIEDAVQPGETHHLRRSVGAAASPCAVANTCSPRRPRTASFE